MLKPNDRCTDRNYLEETLSYLALEGWYDVDCKEFQPVVCYRYMEEYTQSPSGMSPNNSR
jgi:hypothetical protein